ncbi:MAG TPA: hypothetical protein DET40_18505 [Lentisphaeria bacterium]|nr:MAG: hypothetical protein A2X45_14645 [Lentisphaerae bacterium GWF2_50_93]HCE45536.1 hypothetical protein [Lentisphaeria bacterium]
MKRLYDDSLPRYWHTFILPGETPEEYFKEHWEYDKEHDIKFNPLEEPYRKYKRIRDSLEGGRGYVDSDFFRIFHRNGDSYFSLQGKLPVAGKENEYEMKGLGSIRAKDTYMVDDLLEVRPELKNDFYFTVNSYYRAHKWKYQTGLNGIHRKESNLSYLNACYVDIDVGRFEDEEILKHFDWRQALFYSIMLQEDDVIPRVSIYAKSGRGLYLFWLLEEGTEAFPEKVARYKKINKAIQKLILPGIFVDTPGDAARVLRVDGSINRVAKEAVSYYLDDNECEGLKTYSLDELENILVEEPDVKLRKAEKFIEKSSGSQAMPNRAKGGISVNAQRLEDALKLFGHNGGFRKGKRYTSLKYIIRFMRLSMHNREEILEQVTELSRGCNPSYPSKGEENDIPVCDIIKQEYSGKSGIPLNLRHDYLAEFFEVDEQLSEKLSLRTIRPIPHCPPKKPLAARKSDRKGAIIEILRGAAESSYADISKDLSEKHGIKATRMTVMRDLRELKKKSPELFPL